MGDHRTHLEAKRMQYILTPDRHISFFLKKDEERLMRYTHPASPGDLFRNG